MAYDNTNSGAMFKSPPKRTDNDRDYNGSLEIVCPHCRKVSDHWISCWVNVASDRAKNPGQQYFSLKFTPKDDGPPAKDPPTMAPPKDFEDDVPF